MSNEAANVDAQTEALAEVLAKAYHASPYRDAHVRGARAILDAGYMLPEPPTDNEREALIAILDDGANWHYTGVHTVFVPSREAIEAATAAYRDFPGDHVERSSREWQSARMRAALEAAHHAEAGR